VVVHGELNLSGLTHHSKLHMCNSFVRKVCQTAKVQFAVHHHSLAPQESRVQPRVIMPHL
jgi:hypothetical protein